MKRAMVIFMLTTVAAIAQPVTEPPPHPAKPPCVPAGIVYDEQTNTVTDFGGWVVRAPNTVERQRGDRLRWVKGDEVFEVPEICLRENGAPRPGNR